MRVLTGIMAAALLAGAVSTGVRAADKKTVEVPGEGAKQLDITLEFGAGELWITPESMSQAAVFDITYDADKVDCDVDYKLRGSTMRLTAESDYYADGHSVDTDDNEWRVKLSRQYPMRLAMDIGACDAELDLGGLQLEELSMEIGAASSDITFSEPNPLRMEELRFEAGASSVTATGLGNANFDLCTFEGGAGSFNLDFGGEYRGESEIELEIGLGSADITLPEGVPCRIVGVDGGFLSSVDVHGGDLDRISDDVYESPDFDEAQTRIIVRLSVGVGSVDIRFQ